MVISPAIPCRDGRDMKNYVSRIPGLEEDDRVTKDHPELLELLKKIDPEQKYFYYPETCEHGALLPSNKKDGVTDDDKARAELLRKGKNVWQPYAQKQRTWWDWVRGRRFGRPEVWKAPSQKKIDHLRKAIDLLHENGIIHGDLHGHNIIFGEDNLPRIIDFGFAQIHANRSQIRREAERIEKNWPHFYFRERVAYTKRANFRWLPKKLW